MLTTTQPVPQQRIDLTSALPPAATTAPPRPRFFGRDGVHLVVVAVAALSLGGGMGAAANSSAGHTKRSPTAAASLPVAAAAPAPHKAAAVANQPAAHHQTGASKQPAAAPAKPNDKGWAVVSLNVKRDFIGAFTGT